MILLDSSSWVEFLTDGPHAAQSRRALECGETILTPTIVIYEVYKIMRRAYPDTEALTAVARMREGVILALDENIAIAAADISLTHRLPMADAIVYATAQTLGATLVTCDAHFADLPGVEYLPAE